MNLNEMIWIDLPSLQSITLGEFALYGRYDMSCLLTMSGMIDINRDYFNRFAKA